MVSIWSGVVLNGEYYERVFVMITGDEMMVCIYNQTEWVTVTINNWPIRRDLEVTKIYKKERRGISSFL